MPTILTKQTAEQLAQRDSINLLYSSVVGSVIAHSAVSLAFTFIFNKNIDAELTYIWCLGLGLLQILRFIDFIFWKVKLEGREYDYTWPKIRFLITTYLGALIWTALVVIAFDQLGKEEFSALAIICLTFGAAVSTTLAGNKWLSLLYAMTMVVPISVLAILSDTLYINTFGVLGILFIFVISVSCVKSCQFTQHAMLTQRQNEALLEQQKHHISEMEEKNKEIILINKGLEQKIEERTKHIWDLSNKDPLTNLYNRKAFLNTLDKNFVTSQNYSNELAVLFIDLDGFKLINDQKGHATGDEILKSVANKLVSITDNTANVCRWGGDEFIVAINNTARNEVEIIANLIIEALKVPIKCDDELVNVGATIGIAFYEKSVKNTQQLIDSADSAMYEQKQTEKNKVRLYSQSTIDI